MADGSGVRAEIAALTAEVRALRDEVRQMRSDLCGRIGNHEERLRAAEGDLIRLDQRMGVWAGLLMALNLLASSVAAWLGIRR